jgi:hypothetical protein
MLHTEVAWMDPSYRYPSNWYPGDALNTSRTSHDKEGLSVKAESSLQRRRPTCMSVQERRVRSATIARMRQKSLKISPGGLTNSTEDLDMAAVKDEVAKQPRPQTANPCGHNCDMLRSSSINLKNNSHLHPHLTCAMSVESSRANTPTNSMSNTNKGRSQSARYRRPITADSVVLSPSRGPDINYYDRHARCFNDHTGFFLGSGLKPLPEEQQIFLRYGPMLQDWQDEQDAIRIPCSVSMATEKDTTCMREYNLTMSRRPQTAPSTVSFIFV